MKEKTTSTILYPILSSLSGMIIGFTIFLLTEKIIFLIVCLTLGITHGIALSQSNQNEED
jgi:uncharacterized membrane protein